MRALAALALASFAPLAAPPAQQPKPAAKDAPAVAGELGRKLDRLVQQFDPGGGGFSGSVMVAKGGKVLIEKGSGLHDAAGKVPIGVGALWDWASVSKLRSTPLGSYPSAEAAIADTVPRHMIHDST